MSVHSTDSPPQKEAKYLVWLDLNRILAAVAIIWMHSIDAPSIKPLTVIARFAVPFYSATAAFLAYGPTHTPKTTIGAYTWARGTRIIPPYLGWCAIYFAVRLVAAAFSPHSQPPRIGLSVLWPSAAYHLWFLPFIFIVTIVSHLTKRLVSRQASLRWLLLVMSAATIAVMCLIRVSLKSDPFDPPALKYIYDSSLASLAGLILALVCGRVGSQWLGTRPIAIVGVVGFIACQVMLVLIGRQFAIEALAGVSLLLASFITSAPKLLARWASLGAVTYGVYLVHVLFVECLQDAARLAGVGEIASRDVAVFVAATALSVAAAWMLRQCKWTTWLSP